MDAFTYDALTGLLWRLLVLGPPLGPAFLVVRRAKRDIESKLALAGIGVATYARAAFVWLGAVFWLFGDLFKRW
jgi:hypothetical protein